MFSLKRLHCITLQTKILKRQNRNNTLAPIFHCLNTAGNSLEILDAL